MILANCFILKARCKTVYTRLISVIIVTQKSDNVKKRQLKVSEHCKKTIVGISNMRRSGGGGGGVCPLENFPESAQAKHLCHTLFLEIPLHVLN